MIAPANLVRTPEEFADILSLELTPGLEKDLREFRKWKDFPKLKDGGCDKDELLEFLERNKLKIASRKATAQLLTAGAKTTAADLKLIRETAEKPSKLGDADTLTALAEVMDAHYRGRIRILITKGMVNHWRGGRSLPKGAPLPPGKIGNSSRYDVGEWVAWFDKWQLDRYKIGTNSELDGQAANLEAQQRQNELERIEHERFERSVERGKWVEREVAKRTIIGALKTFHNTVKAADERNAPLARKAKLAELGVAAEVIAAFHDFDLRLAKDITDEREHQCNMLSVDAK